MAAPRQGLPVRLERAPHRGGALVFSPPEIAVRIIGLAAWALLVSAVLALTPFSLARAQDCNARCCKEIRITPWDRNEVCDPACKLACEAAKSTGVPLPIPPSIVNEVVKALEQSCAAGFETVTKAFIATQGFYPAGSDFLLNQSHDVLIRTNLFTPADFNGLTIRWCSLKGKTTGMTPDRNLICIKVINGSTRIIP